MTTDLTNQEKTLIYTKILEKYARAAVSPAGSFNYPTGVQGLRQLSYPEEWWRDFPPALSELFCGVGNPFSLGPLRPGETVLDIGCGAGFDAAVAARLVGREGRVVGLDISPEMVIRAWELSANLPFRNGSFQVASAECLPFPARFFDVVTSNGAFNLVIDKDQAAREILRVLKPGGRLHLADMALVTPLPPERANRIDNWYQ
jgi:arsenite methyltransferase|uniref:Methyltransferase domain-containing protein n=1 Tax=Desulfobacca acetoxidans TaxID=60893 RepID=A0A7V6A5B1_9BACT